MEEYQKKSHKTWWLIAVAIVLIGIFIVQFFRSYGTAVISQNNTSVTLQLEKTKQVFYSAQKIDDKSFIHQEKCKLILDDIFTEDIERYLVNKETMELLIPESSNLMTKGKYMIYDVTYEDMGRHRILFSPKREGWWNQIAMIDLQENGCDGSIDILLADKLN